MSTDKNKHLECVLESHKIRKKIALLNKHIDKRNEIVSQLEQHYQAQLYKPFDSGSYAKHTAVNKKFDFDLIIPFKRNHFSTLEEMYNSVHDFLYKKYKEKATIRKQKVSIGIEFLPDSENEIVKIDVVPGRELNDKQFLIDNKLNLHIHSQFGKIEAGSTRLQSNIKAQIENIKENSDKKSLREIVRLLKIWKIHLNKGLKSFYIELITIKAFERKAIDGDLWNRLKVVLEFIRDNIKNLSLPDPGNSNNDVADTLTDFEKDQISVDMMLMIKNIESNDDSIKMYFIANSEFPCKDENQKDYKYGEKATGISIPPPKRFG